MDFDKEWDSFDVAKESKVFGSYRITRAHNALRKELEAERARADELQSEVRAGSFLTARATDTARQYEMDKNLAQARLYLVSEALRCGIDEVVDAARDAVCDCGYAQANVVLLRAALSGVDAALGNGVYEDLWPKNMTRGQAVMRLRRIAELVKALNTSSVRLEEINDEGDRSREDA